MRCQQVYRNPKKFFLAVASKVLKNFTAIIVVENRMFWEMQDFEVLDTYLKF